MLSNSQLTKLGGRLRGNDIRDSDLADLDAFRQTFSDIDEQAYRIIKDALNPHNELVITKRKRKTQQSIVDKLRRQINLRLPQMQDIAGCRIVLQRGWQQAQNVAAILVDTFENKQWRTQSKSRHAYGYQAIHIVIKSEKKFYEIQLRTFAQDIWANLVESASNKQNTLKYGGTDQEQPLAKKLVRLAAEFNIIDTNAHAMSLEVYQQQVQEAIENVLSD